MNSKLHFITVEKTAIVVTKGNPDAGTIWVALHGYGQHAETFQNKFNIFNCLQNYFVFPDALNRFYLKAGKGDTGASWMTKYYREKDIEDNNKYLNKIYTEFVMPLLNGKKKKLYTLGFSQGAATLIRWLAYSKINPDRVLLWGAVFPPDISHKEHLKKLKSLKWLYFIGTEDEYISKEEKIQQKEFFDKNEFNLEWIEYAGKHDIIPELLINHVIQ